MQVLLRQDVDSLGLRGDLVNVARGYARNYLLPRGLAELATPGLLKELERRETIRARHEAQTTDEAQAIKAKLEGAELRIDVTAGPTGSLFGSVTATNVADKLWEDLKVRVDRRKLTMSSIKRIGRYTIPVNVFGDVTAELRLLVVPEGGELPPQEELDAAAAEESQAEAQAEQADIAAEAEVEAALAADDEADETAIEADEDAVAEELESAPGDDEEPADE